MNAELDRLLSSLAADTPQHEALRRRFGLLCVRRVEHFLEQAAVIDVLSRFAALVEGGATAEAFAPLAAEAGDLARRHEGSRSLDGAGHAAVSATYACAAAVAGRARQAAEYAAYAAVYGEGGYGATSDPRSFEPEQAWQAEQLRRLLDGGRP